MLQSTDLLVKTTIYSLLAASVEPCRATHPGGHARRAPTMGIEQMYHKSSGTVAYRRMPRAYSSQATKVKERYGHSLLCSN